MTDRERDKEREKERESNRNSWAAKKRLDCAMIESTWQYCTILSMTTGECTCAISTYWQVSVLLYDKWVRRLRWYTIQFLFSIPSWARDPRSPDSYLSSYYYITLHYITLHNIYFVFHSFKMIYSFFLLHFHYSKYYNLIIIMIRRIVCEF